MKKEPNEREQIFLQDKGFWEERIRKLYKKKYADAFVEYVSTPATLRKVGKKVGVSPERVRQMVVYILRYIYKASLRRTTQEQLQEYRSKRYHNRLTQDEFYRAKEFLFEGVPIAEVAILINRSHKVIDRISKSNSLEEYYKQHATYMNNWNKNRREQQERDKQSLHNLLTNKV